jgi:hypothetical protein
MTLCTSCGNQVEESASFCTSCGKPMPTAAHPSAAVMVARPVCSSCGAATDPGSIFCTECGQRLDVEPAPVAEAPAVANAVPPSGEGASATSPTAFCTNCGSKMEHGTGFCTNCGQPTTSSSVAASEPATNVATSGLTLKATQPVITNPINATPASTARTTADPLIAAPAPSRVESTPSVSPVPPLVEDQTEHRPVVAAPINPTPVQPIPVEPGPVKAALVEPNPVEPAPQLAAPVYTTRSEYPPAQPGGGAFRVIVLILLLSILVGGFGGWYFMGVETVIVCSPPDVTVFLDNKELAPTSYGRYVIPHLSRQSHLLKVQRPGFADTIERLDFPMTSRHEWVNIKLVPRRATRPSSSR